MNYMLFSDTRYLHPESYWCKLVYSLNCRIGRAFRAGEHDAAQRMIGLLDLIHPGQAEYNRRYNTPFGRAGL
jgi:hypothetical protein